MLTSGWDLAQASNFVIIISTPFVSTLGRISVGHCPHFMLLVDATQPPLSLGEAKSLHGQPGIVTLRSLRPY